MLIGFFLAVLLAGPYVTDYLHPVAGDIVLSSGTWTIDNLTATYPLQVSPNHVLSSSVVVSKNATLILNNTKVQFLSPFHLLVFGKAVIINSRIFSTDGEPHHPRPFLAAVDGGRMNISGSQISGMGFALSKISGIAAVNYFNSSHFYVENSTLSNDYYGYYSQYASDFVLATNSAFNNTGYGFDPHTYSHNFRISNNTVYHNGKQGIICSFECSNFTISFHHVYNNSEGIGVHWLSNSSRVFNNTVDYNTHYGIFIENESSGNVIANNTLIGNAFGIGLIQASTGNTVVQNLLVNNTRNTVYSDPVSSSNTVNNNRFSMATANVPELDGLMALGFAFAALVVWRHLARSWH